MHVVQQAVADGIGDGGVTDPAVVVLDRQLMGDESPPPGRAVVDDLQQVATQVGVDRAHTPIVEHQHVDASQLQQLLPGI